MAVGGKVCRHGSRTKGVNRKKPYNRGFAAVADSDSLDWKDYDAATICERVTSRVKEGSIVLFHNAALHTPEALPQILEYLIHEGFTIVPISELLLEGEYTIDHTGRQWPVVEENPE